MAARRPEIGIKRAYEAAAAADGTRVLVDRLWPRGVTKDALAIDLWIKEIAPSDELRRWFGHDVARWEEFRRRYERELAAHAAILDTLRATARNGRLTLVYGARDRDHNDAIVLRDVLARVPYGARPAHKRADRARGASATKAR